ncbi:MAG: hypothetical protein VCD66_04090 [Alphaproteobacteria bacterium]
MVAILIFGLAIAIGLVLAGIALFPAYECKAPLIGGAAERTMYLGPGDIPARCH